MMKLWAARITVAVTFAALGLSSYSFLVLRGWLDDNRSKTDDAAAQAQANEDAIRRLRELTMNLRDLTIRVTRVEHPSPERLRASIYAALKRCGGDPVCLSLFVQVERQARERVREIRRRQAQARRNPPGPPAPADHPAPTPQHPTPGTPGPRGGPGHQGSPGQNGSPGSPGSSPTPSRPRPPIDITVPDLGLPVPTPTPGVCSPVVGVNCP